MKKVIIHQLNQYHIAKKGGMFILVDDEKERTKAILLFQLQIYQKYKFYGKYVEV